MLRRTYKRKQNKGFTIAEMLIVVAVIAILTAIAIPVFSAQLEKSREAADISAVRSAYAEVMIAAIQEDTSSTFYDSSRNRYSKTVSLTQKKDGWETKDADKLDIGGVLRSDTNHWKGDAKANGTCTVIYDISTDEVTLLWSGYTVKTNWQWKNIDGYLHIAEHNLDGNWPCNAVPDFIKVKYGTGQKVVVKQITEKEFPKLYEHIQSGGGYEIGISLTDMEGKELADTGGKYIGREKISFETTGDVFAWPSTERPKNGEDVQLAIQFFKMNSGSNHYQKSTPMSEAEARELENIFYVTDK